MFRFIKNYFIAAFFVSIVNISSHAMILENHTGESLRVVVWGKIEGARLPSITNEKKLDNGESWDLSKDWDRGSIVTYLKRLQNSLQPGQDGILIICALALTRDTRIDYPNNMGIKINKDDRNLTFLNKRVLFKGNDKFEELPL